MTIFFSGTAKFLKTGRQHKNTSLNRINEVTAAVSFYDRASVEYPAADRRTDCIDRQARKKGTSMSYAPTVNCRGVVGADDEARTRYLNLGKVALYQMSYIRRKELSAIRMKGNCWSG